MHVHARFAGNLKTLSVWVQDSAEIGFTNFGINQEWNMEHGTTTEKVEATLWENLGIR